MRSTSLSAPVRDLSRTLAPPALVLERVSVRYGDFFALRDVTIHAPNGSITGFIGRNGAGKTTTVRLLAGLLSPAAGEVQVLGKRFPEGGPGIKRNTGYLLDTPALFSYLTAEETLLFLAEGYGLPRSEQEQRAESLLSFFGLWEGRRRLVDEFSTGMRKRLALAAALVHRPRLLVLDEPFESLDPLMVRRLKGLFTRFVAGGGTILLSSHLIDVVQEICDRVVILERGEVVVSGKTRDALTRISGLLEGGALEELYASVVLEETGEKLNWLTE